MPNTPLPEQLRHCGEGRARYRRPPTPESRSQKQVRYRSDRYSCSCSCSVRVDGDSRHIRCPGELLFALGARRGRGTGRGSKRATSTENEGTHTTLNPASSPIHAQLSFGIGRVPKPSTSTENDPADATLNPANSPILARLSFGTGRALSSDLARCWPPGTKATHSNLHSTFVSRHSSRGVECAARTIWSLSHRS